MQTEIKKFIYTVDGLNLSTTTLLLAIKEAKEKAIKEKERQTIRLNGNKYALIDRKGVLIAA